MSIWSSWMVCITTIKMASACFSYLESSIVNIIKISFIYIAPFKTNIAKCYTSASVHANKTIYTYTDRRLKFCGWRQRYWPLTCCSGPLAWLAAPGMLTLFLWMYFRKTSAFLRARVHACSTVTPCLWQTCTHDKDHVTPIPCQWDWQRSWKCARKFIDSAGSAAVNIQV